MRKAGALLSSPIFATDRAVMMESYACRDRFDTTKVGFAITLFLSKVLNNLSCGQQPQLNKGRFLSRTSAYQ
jgi:hypothetical protein